MRGLRWGLGGLMRAGVGALVLGPVAALALAAVLDRGGGRSAGPTALPLALGVWDPFLRACALNSLVVAAGVAAGSLALGVAWARITARRRFWGRGPLRALGLIGLAVPPLFGAIGLT